MTLEEFKSIEDLLKASADDFSMGIEAIKHYTTLKKCTHTHLYLLSKCLLFHDTRHAFMDKLGLEGIMLMSDGCIDSDRQVMLNLVGLYNNKNLVDKKDKNLIKIFSYITEEVIFRLIRSLKLDEIIDNIKIKLK